MVDLYHRLHGLDDPLLVKALSGSDEDLLVALGGKPALLSVPGRDHSVPARMVSCLLHGNEDSGLRAVLALLRAGVALPYGLWVFIGNVRAATQHGFFAHRYLSDQEDFNRVWGLQAPTTRMRRCADAVLDEVTARPLAAAIDLHNNTGVNPPYSVLPVRTPQTLALAALCGDTALQWGWEAHTLMEALTSHCPAIAVECGLSGLAVNAAYASGVLDRFLAADLEQVAPHPPLRLFEMLARVQVRPEVPFAFGGPLTDEVDLALTPGLDGSNFGMLLAGTELGRAHPGAAMPLTATDMFGVEQADRYFMLTADGVLRVNEDLTPAMMTTTAEQARRDCLFYLTRRRV